MNDKGSGKNNKVLLAVIILCIVLAVAVVILLLMLKSKSEPVSEPEPAEVSDISQDEGDTYAFDEMFSLVDNFEIPINQQLCSYEGVVFTANRIYVPNSTINENLNYNVELEIQNNGENSYEFDNCTLRVEGFVIHASALDRVDPGKKAVVDVAIDQDRLAYTDVKSFDSIEIRVGLTNSDNYKDKFDSGFIPINLSKEINIHSRTADNSVLWEDNAIRITFLGVTTKNVGNSTGEITEKCYYFYLLKENFTDMDNLSFAVDFNGNYRNNEAMDYCYENDSRYLPENGKELSVIAGVSTPIETRSNEFEFRVVAEMDSYDEFLSGKYCIKTNENDELESASGTFEPSEDYDTYMKKVKASGTHSSTNKNDLSNSQSSSENNTTSSTISTSSNNTGNESKEKTTQTSDVVLYSIEDKNGNITFMEPISSREIKVSQIKVNSDSYYALSLEQFTQAELNKVLQLGYFEGMAAIEFIKDVSNCYGITFKYYVCSDESDKYSNYDWYLGIYDNEGAYIAGSKIEKSRFRVLDTDTDITADNMDKLSMFSKEPWNVHYVVLFPDFEEPQFYFGFDGLSIELYFKNATDISEFLYQIL